MSQQSRCTLFFSCEGLLPLMLPFPPVSPSSYHVKGHKGDYFFFTLGAVTKGVVVYNCRVFDSSFAFYGTFAHSPVAEFT